MQDFKTQNAQLNTMLKVPLVYKGVISNHVARAAIGQDGPSVAVVDGVVVVVNHLFIRVAGNEATIHLTIILSPDGG